MSARGGHTLVIGLQGLGNLLLTAPLLADLTEQLECEVTLLVPDHAARQLMAALPGSREIVVAADFGQMRLARLLRSRHFATTVIAYPGGPRSVLLAFATGARLRIGHVGRVGWLAKRLLTDALPASGSYHDVERNLELSARLAGRLDRQLVRGEPRLAVVPGDGIEVADRWLLDQGLSGKRLIGIVPGSGRRQSFKRWPLESFWQAATGIAGGLPGATPLWFCGPDEIDLANEVRRLASGPIGIAEGLPILVTAALLQRCSLVIANDNGLMHLARAQGVPVVAVFGPTDPARTRPWGRPASVLYGELACRPCYSARKRGFRCVNPEPFACLAAVTPEQVVVAALKLARAAGSTGGEGA